MNRITEGRRAGEAREIGGVIFSWCPPGEFTMNAGIPEPDLSQKVHSTPSPACRVKLTKGFWISRIPCTQSQFRFVMGKNPSEFRMLFGLGNKLPVERVLWEEAMEFCELFRCRIPQADGWVATLPTEAQWEYACSANSKTRFPFGEWSNGTQANCNGHFPYATLEKGPFVRKTTKAGRYPANAWGIYDMLGNVNEWCFDWYEPFISFEEKIDPKGPDFPTPIDASHVLKGGCFLDPSSSCSVSARHTITRSVRGQAIGFRVAIVSD